MRILPLLLLLLAAGPLHAQDDWQRFYPLSVGDTWEYTHEVERCWTDQEPPDNCTTQTDAVVRRAVTGEVEIEGVAFAKMDIEMLDPVTLEPGCEATYGVRLDEETAQVEVAEVAGTCIAAFSAFEEMVALTVGTTSSDEFEIGGLSYDLVIRSSRTDPTAFDELYTWYGRDVGLLMLWDVNHVTASSLNTYHRLTLQYAEVGGVAYGQPVVANEGPASPNEALRATLYPSPTRGPVVLDLEGAASGPAELEVFDVLGRRVLNRDLSAQPSGTSQYRLNLSDVPAGIYVVRLSTRSGETATRRLVKVD